MDDVAIKSATAFEDVFIGWIMKPVLIIAYANFVIKNWYISRRNWWFSLPRIDCLFFISNSAFNGSNPISIDHCRRRPENLSLPRLQPWKSPSDVPVLPPLRLDAADEQQRNRDCEVHEPMKRRRFRRFFQPESHG